MKVTLLMSVLTKSCDADDFAAEVEEDFKRVRIYQLQSKSLPSVATFATIGGPPL